MITEPPPPKNLRNIQRWFAGIITQPIDYDNNINPVTPRGNSIIEEAAQYIAPSPTLKEYQRIEIYNQQYWWRLLGVLHDSFPTLLRLFGYREFNQVFGFPYLVQYQPNHWSLSYLGERLPYWIQRFYKAEDKPLIQAGASIDNAFTLSFIAPHHPPVTADDLESVMDQTLRLQPHIFLFRYNRTFFQFRDILLDQEPDYWLENDFPPLDKEKSSAYMVWRDHHNVVGWIHLDINEYRLLKKFQKGCSFDELCEWLETQSAQLNKAAAEHLQEWTHRWILNEWLHKN